MDVRPVVGTRIARSPVPRRALAERNDRDHGRLAPQDRGHRPTHEANRLAVRPLRRSVGSLRVPVKTRRARPAPGDGASVYVTAAPSSGRAARRDTACRDIAPRRGSVARRTHPRRRRPRRRNIIQPGAARSAQPAASRRTASGADTRRGTCSRPRHRLSPRRRRGHLIRCSRTDRPTDGCCPCCRDARRTALRPRRDDHRRQRLHRRRVHRNAVRHRRAAAPPWTPTRAHRPAPG